MLDFDEPTTSRSAAIRRLGRYQLLEKLGEGGMGAVYVALRDGADHLCVLKQLHPEIAQNAVAAQRFYREATVGSRLDHPGIAQVLGAGTEEGIFCIAMELVAGFDLEVMTQALLASGALLPPELLVYVGTRALDALAYAHELRADDGAPMGLVHRDITPRNIMVALDGAVKLIDFGLVRATGDDLRTRPGVFLGTPRFASPEQASGGAVDRRSDLYSLSAVLYECLSGVPVVAPGPLVSMLSSIVLQAPRPLVEVNPAISPELAAVIMRGLAKQPAERWPDAASFARALRGTIREEPRPQDVAMFMLRSFPDALGRVRATLEAGERLVAELSDRTAGGENSFSHSERSLRSFDEEDGTQTFIEFTAASTRRPSLPPELADTFASGRPLSPAQAPGRPARPPIRAPSTLRAGERAQASPPMVPRDPATGPLPAVAALPQDASRPAERELPVAAASRGWLPMVIVAVVASVGASTLTALLLRPPATVQVVAEPGPPPGAPTGVIVEPAPPASPAASVVSAPAVRASSAPAGPKPAATPSASALASPRALAAPPRASPRASAASESPPSPAPSAEPSPLTSAAPPARSPLARQLDAYLAEPSDAARDELLRAFAAHPAASRVQRELTLARQAPSHTAVARQLSLALKKLEP